MHALLALLAPRTSVSQGQALGSSIPVKGHWSVPFLNISFIITICFRNTYYF